MQNLDGALENYTSFMLDKFRETYFPDSDIVSYYGGITFWSKHVFQPTISALGKAARNRDIKKLVIMLHTTGGSVESVEKLVEITRNFYDEVYFIIPDFAMSAGTIWCMSGDKIYMDYASSLGPIDPQVLNSENKWVPALGYLDKVEEIINKSQQGNVTQAELMMLNRLDLAELRRYEEARELSKELLKKWLVDYKFKDWTHKEASGAAVTHQDKVDRAEKIAVELSNNRRWHSHSRLIGISTIKNVLELKVEDYSDNESLSSDINLIHNLLIEFGMKSNREIVVIGSSPIPVTDDHHEEEDHE
ncbi:serine dehydrogenasease [Morganella morganii subsp. morganii]|uniref:SDH family Clp fold serine proteinase n=1 Tax=Morganella morganii TaxID=582 RepID=UPI001BD996D7|nr:serine dehydrogenasease [Morganella morganii]MBT0368812.1 serine dehydrogenasease [Morganella morganii subsp. morganii]HEI8419563.1 serine dehydrogenasease [Morganella morganii]